MKLAGRILVGLIVAVCVVYVGDDLSARFRIPGNRDPFGTLTVKRYYAISEKNNRIQLLPADPETVTCVYSLFPHFGYSPCWYASRTKQKQVDL
jgi:hypothetical protein